MDSPADQNESPKTAAAIDIGANSIRLVIAEFFPDGRIEVIEQLRQPVRLGHDVFVSGKLKQRTISSAIAVLRDYRRLLDTYQVESIRAVATTAIREAANQDAFLDRVSRTVNLNIDVIEPMEQSRLIVAAVFNDVGDAVDLKKGSAMIAEVGGGGTLLTVLKRGEISASQSYDLGSIRMQETLSTTNLPPRRAAEMLRLHLSNAFQSARRSLGIRAVRTFIAIGGDARFAAQQVGDQLRSDGLYSVGKVQLDQLIVECVSHGPERLAKQYNMTYQDVETLVPALLVYQALLHATRASKMIVSKVSMREGLLLDLPRYVIGQEDPQLEESIIASARTLATRYHDDTKHSEQVAAIAVRLFDELQRDHGLKPRQRLLLRVSALLHEIGKFVSNRAHHRHSRYLISNSEIFGLRPADITTVAYVAGLHRRTPPKTTDLEYMALSGEQRMEINKLAAILRVADALDKAHWQQVRDFDVLRHNGDLVIHIRSAIDLSLERRALAMKSNLFEDIFGMRVRIEESVTPVARDSDIPVTE
jgi:exopolyphosphatase/guanosine-5'-triphosphate,3'-diphosphate pyrophosphatase